jgi:hypothetical protein
MRSRLFLRMHHAYLNQATMNGEAIANRVGFLKLLESSDGKDGSSKDSPSDILTSVTAGMCLAIARSMGRESECIAMLSPMRYLI